MEALIPIVAIIGAFGVTGYIAWVILEGIRTRSQAALTREFSNKLLDRVASADQLTALMTSDGGKRLLSTISGRHAATTAHARILRALQTGLVVIALGVGLFLYIWMNPSLLLEEFEAIALLATVGVALGFGLLLSAAAAFVMSRKLGLLDGQSHQHADPVHSL